MGCWNKTCALSNLPIYAGDEVYVFVLYNNPYAESNSSCYSTDLYNPIFLPFESEYDAYGGGENSSGVAFPIIMDILRNNLIEKEVGENKYHDIAVKKDNFDENLFYTSIQENRLEINTNTGLRKVKFVMMRKDVIDSILDEWVIEEYEGYDSVKEESIYFKYKFSNVISSVNDFILGYDTNNLNLNNFAHEMTEKGKNLAAKWLGAEPWSTIKTKDIVSNTLDFVPSVDSHELITTYIKGLFIHAFMERGRRTWQPPIGEGSQGEDFDVHELLAKTVIGTIESIQKEQDSW
jgi:hypothetical protein